MSSVLCVLLRAQGRVHMLPDGEQLYEPLQHHENWCSDLMMRTEHQIMVFRTCQPRQLHKMIRHLIGDLTSWNVRAD